MSEIKTIVVGLDGSEPSRSALRWAYDEAAHHGAKLEAVAAWHLPVLPMTPPFGSIQDEGYAEGQERKALAELERVIEEVGGPAKDVEVTAVIEKGNPVKVLLDRSQNADLLVVGSRGRDGFAGMLLGSVSQHLVAHAACPVVVLR